MMWLLPALISGLWAQGSAGRGTPVKAVLHEVRLEKVKQTVPAIGTLRANEAVDLVPEISRRVVKIPFEEGGKVAAGDLLFQLDDAEILAALAETKARAGLAKKNADRATRLVPGKAISTQEYELAKVELEILQAQVQAQEVELAKTRIKAPFAGRIGTRRVSAGAYVVPGTVLATLQDVSRIKVDFTLPERYASEVREGLDFTFRVAGNGREFNGKVDVVEPELDAATRSVRLRGICHETDGLFPGGFAEVRLALAGEVETITVPTQAIIPSPRGEAVFLIRNGKAQMQPVETGDRSPSSVRILKGLNPGDKVAVTNLLRIRPGMEVVAEDTAAP